jgi:signal transduction histidine kinase
VAYGIIQDYGGWIDVDSEPGRGSRFSVYVPLCPDTAATGAAEDMA